MKNNACKISFLVFHLILDACIASDITTGNLNNLNNSTLNSELNTCVSQANLKPFEVRQINQDCAKIRDVDAKMDETHSAFIEEPKISLIKKQKHRYPNYVRKDIFFGKINNDKCCNNPQKTIRDRQPSRNIYGHSATNNSPQRLANQNQYSAQPNLNLLNVIYGLQNFYNPQCTLYLFCPPNLQFVQPNLNLSYSTNNFQNYCTLNNPLTYNHVCINNNININNIQTNNIIDIRNCSEKNKKPLVANINNFSSSAEKYFEDILTKVRTSFTLCKEDYDDFLKNKIDKSCNSAQLQDRFIKFFCQFSIAYMDFDRIIRKFMNADEINKSNFCWKIVHEVKAFNKTMIGATASWIIQNMEPSYVTHSWTVFVTAYTYKLFGINTLKEEIAKIIIPQLRNVFHKTILSNYMPNSTTNGGTIKKYIKNIRGAWQSNQAAKYKIANTKIIDAYYRVPMNLLIPGTDRKTLLYVVLSFCYSMLDENFKWLYFDQITKNLGKIASVDISLEDEKGVELITNRLNRTLLQFKSVLECGFCTVTLNEILPKDVIEYLGDKKVDLYTKLGRLLEQSKVKIACNNMNSNSTVPLNPKIYNSSGFCKDEEAEKDEEVEIVLKKLKKHQWW